MLGKLLQSVENKYIKYEEAFDCLYINACTITEYLMVCSGLIKILLKCTVAYVYAFTSLINEASNNPHYFPAKN